MIVVSWLKWVVFLLTIGVHGLLGEKWFLLIPLATFRKMPTLMARIAFKGGFLIV